MKFTAILAILLGAYSIHSFADDFITDPGVPKRCWQEVYTKLPRHPAFKDGTFKVDVQMDSMTNQQIWSLMNTVSTTFPQTKFPEMVTWFDVSKPAGDIGMSLILSVADTVNPNQDRENLIATVNGAISALMSIPGIQANCYLGGP